MTMQEPGKALPYLKRIAQHYEAAGSWADAERYLVKAGLALEAADMHARAGRWEAAQKVSAPPSCRLLLADCWLSSCWGSHAVCDSCVGGLQVARGYLPEAQARAFFSRRARECEAQGRLKEAERAFVQVRSPLQIKCPLAAAWNSCRRWRWRAPPARAAADAQ